MCEKLKQVFFFKQKSYFSHLPTWLPTVQGKKVVLCHSYPFFFFFSLQKERFSLLYKEDLGPAQPFGGLGGHLSP